MKQDVRDAFMVMNEEAQAEINRLHPSARRIRTVRLRSVPPKPQP